MILLNDKEVTFGAFPNGETNLPLEQLEIKETNDIQWDYENDAEIFKLALLKTHLDSMNSETGIYITYLPYSRMDRPNEDYAVSLDCIGKMINDMKFTNICIREPHSQASTDILDVTVDWWVERYMHRIIKEYNIGSVFYPDAGARDRYSNDKYRFAMGSKTRDFKTSKIVGFEAHGYVADNVLIVDDLCSRGGTFVESAKQLKQMGAKNIYLIVAHCENNVFTGEIFDYIDKIFTSPEMLDRDHPRIIKLDD